MGHLRIDGEFMLLNGDGLALLADLALADGPLSRDVVIERIWPSASEPDGRVRLRRNLHVINNLLEGAIVRPTPGTLALAPHARNAADCIAFANWRAAANAGLKRRASTRPIYRNANGISSIRSSADRPIQSRTRGVLGSGSDQRIATNVRVELPSPLCLP